MNDKRFSNRGGAAVLEPTTVSPPASPPTETKAMTPAEAVLSASLVEALEDQVRSLQQQLADISQRLGPHH